MNAMSEKVNAPMLALIGEITDRAKLQGQIAVENLIVSVPRDPVATCEILDALQVAFEDWTHMNPSVPAHQLDALRGCFKRLREALEKV